MYVMSPTGQDAFWPIPGLISYTGVTGRSTAISCTKCSQVAVSIWQLEAPQMYPLLGEKCVLCESCFILAGQKKPD